MANTISVTSTITQAKTYLIEAPKAKLLQEVFFPTGSEDEFVTKEVLFDLDEGDFGVAPMVSKGYKSENVVTWKATAVEPPRCGLEVSIDPTDRDRQLFESLMYNAKGNRAIAFQDYKRIIAARAAERVSRKIEQLCVSVLMNNAIEGTMPKSPTDDTEVPIEIKFYDDSTGNQQRYLPAYAWGNGNATPYDDICAMVQALSIHGGDPRILLISPEAYALLALDTKYQAFFKTYHSEKSVLTGDDYSGARKVADCVFLGYPLDIVVYGGGYRDENNRMVHYLPKGFVCVLDRGIGHTLCGGCVLCDPVAVISEDVNSDAFRQMRGKIIGSQFIDLRNQSVSVRMESRPLPAPWRNWTWITMDAQNNNAISGGAVGPVISVEFESDDDNATLPADLSNQLGGSAVTIADATTSTGGVSFVGYYVNGVKQTKNSAGKYVLPNVDCIFEARFA